ncbi:MAG: hypothetical protein A2700_01450 [Candidatus Blackburnbacteria bacterium RIFCSPHIGHO2_01_FULL_44_64]|nr:MAG: hypothetical protein A2700_01450 [Candidatus Blackburnbacteria bacterium RIFCSPHIGHO2_01_FULL_44_64]HXK35547.1 hypothetical protein [Candidatus Paceibacterota bacterium]
MFNSKTLAVLALVVALVAGYFSYQSYQKLQTLKPASIARVLLSMQAEQQMLNSLKGRSRVEQNRIIEEFFKNNKVTSSVSLSSASADKSACDLLLDRAAEWNDTPLGTTYLSVYNINCAGTAGATP